LGKQYLNNLKTAVVHDWFAGYAGSERVVESLTNIWNGADVYVLFNFLNEAEQKIILKDSRLFTSFLQKIASKKNYRNFLPLYPFAIEKFDLSKFQLVISSSHAVAKGIKTGSKQLHICYCHTPIRYVWDLRKQYLDQAGLNSGLKGMAAGIILNYIRQWDLKTKDRPDYYIANSRYIAERIKRIYNRDAEVIYPPVDTEKFKCEPVKENYYITASRFVPYKKIDLISEAFAGMPDKKLIIAGEGPEEEKIKSKSSKNIEFAGFKNTEELSTLMQKAKAFVFAAEEDFGIVIIEALSCGTPVIALNRGGAAETVVNNKHGILFNEQTPASIINAVKKFEESETAFNSAELSLYAKNYSRNIFEQKMRKFVEKKCSEFFNKS
jgi:glycosyltransferase involved in cell wall biosynthesis